MIVIENLVKNFRRARILDGMSFEIESGQHVALVGANGAGKTTLIRCLLGEYDFQGQIRIDGLSPRRDRSEILRHVGFVPQLPPPLKMPVKQLIHFAASVCEGSPERMLELGRVLGLEMETVLRQPFVKLSGGQKQKILIALALGRDTRLLLMDEPAANLDTEARRVLFDLLAERAAHTTMMISSHRLDEVAPLVQRVIELDRGKVALDDRVAESGAIDVAALCRLRLRRSEEVVARALRSWGFEGSEDGLCWEGRVVGPDRLRFFGMISRYAGLIDGIHLEGTESDA